MSVLASQFHGGNDLANLVTASSAAHWERARELLQEYSASLDVDLCFQNFSDELAHLETEYAAPTGIFLLAEVNNSFTGCIALRRIDDRLGEIKRLYVSPAGRGHGLGRMLIERVLDAARSIGYDRVVLDTLPSMQTARKLYAGMGFTPTGSYRFNPVEGTVYLTKSLRHADA